MPRKISYLSLVQKVLTETITLPEAELYFKTDEARPRGLAPGIAIDEANVDVAGVERIARENAQELGAQAGKVALEDEFNKTRSPSPNGTIVAEGDSWFSLPPWYQRTLMSHLQLSYPINNVAHMGDTLEDMMIQGQYLPYLQTGRVKFLLFSGGGNDFLGSLTACLNLFDVDHADPSDAPYYLTPFFDQSLKRIDQLYRFLAGQVHQISPNTNLIVHGYDYATPFANGVFLGKQMEGQGLYPAWRKALCDAIIKLMIDRYNEEVLKPLSGFLPNFRYLDLRGKLIRQVEFFDEIHPRSAKVPLLAREFENVLGPPITLADRSRPAAGARRKVAKSRRQSVKKTRKAAKQAAAA
jgi:hypothetical protein